MYGIVVQSPLVSKHASVEKELVCLHGYPLILQRLQLEYTKEDLTAGSKRIQCSQARRTTRAEGEYTLPFSETRDR